MSFENAIYQWQQGERRLKAAPAERGPLLEHVTDALVAELAKLSGLPVFVEISVNTASSAEAPGMPSGTGPPPRPVSARTTVTRRVKNLLVRPGRAGDEALVAVPADYHERGLERLLVGEDLR